MRPSPAKTATIRVGFSTRLTVALTALCFAHAATGQTIIPVDGAWTQPAPKLVLTPPDNVDSLMAMRAIGDKRASNQGKGRALLATAGGFFVAAAAGWIVTGVGTTKKGDDTFMFWSGIGTGSVASLLGVAFTLAGAIVYHLAPTTNNVSLSLQLGSSLGLTGRF